MLSFCCSDKIGKSDNMFLVFHVEQLLYDI